MLYVLRKTAVKMHKNYSPVSRDINSLPQAWHTENKTHVRMWGTTLFPWKLFPNEYCTTLTQRKSNLAVRIARLWESWYQSDVTYSWNVTAAPNYWLSPTNKISSSRWWKTKRLTTGLSFNRSQKYRFQRSISRLDKLLQSEKEKKKHQNHHQQKSLRCYLNMLL